MKTKLKPFHLAILVERRTFYRDILELPEDRNSDQWVGFNFFSHQFKLKKKSFKQKGSSNSVDGKGVPIPHFGVVLDMETFEHFSEKLIQKNCTFIIVPYIRFKDHVGQQAIMLFKDPSGNALEFKAFKDQKKLFAK